MLREYARSVTCGRHEVLLYRTAMGASPVAKKLDKFPKAARAKLYAKLDLAAHREVGTVRLSLVIDDILEAKVEYEGQGFRALVMRIGQHDRNLLVLDVFSKKTQALRSEDVDRARRRRGEWLARGASAR